jgi:predicted phage gp36 major capsid-like protein
MDQELKAYLEGFRAEMNQRFKEMEGSLRNEMNQRFEKTDGSFASFRAEMNQRFEKVHEDNRHTHVVVEGLRHELGLVAEGVSGVFEQMNAAHKEIYKKMDDLKSANVAAYRDLDVRVRTLETRKPRSRAHPQKQ